MSSPQAWKAKSEEQLSSIGVAINPSLPLIEAAEEITLRSPEEVARRGICLTAVVSRSLGDPKDFLIEYVKKKGCYELLTPSELAFLNQSRVTKADKIRFSWQVEALRVLLWALAKAEPSLPSFQQCDPHDDVFPHCSAARNDGSVYIKEATLRPKEDLLGLADLAYRAHWATRQHSLDGTTEVGPLNAGVVLEYHRAINWLTCYGNDDWDDVSTDT